MEIEDEVTDQAYTRHSFYELLAQMSYKKIQIIKYPACVHCVHVYITFGMYGLQSMYPILS